MSNAVAKVAFLQGQAWAKAADGTLRELTVGSVLNDDETLVTAQGARVELDVGGNAEPLVINGGMEVGMSRDFAADTATGADEALLSDASVLEALTVLEQGGDLLEELEETAAGNGGGSGSDGGSSFVRLLRISETTDDLSYIYSDIDVREQEPLEFDGQPVTSPVDEPAPIPEPEPEPVPTPVNSAPEITITNVINLVEDSSAQVGDVIATYTTFDQDGDTVTVTLSDTVNYALDGNGNVTLTAAGLALVNSGADLPAFTLTPNDGTVNGLPASADPAVTPANDTPEITITSVNNFVEDDGAAVGDVVATYTTYDEDGDTVTVILSDTVNYALDGNGNVTLTAAGLALVNSGADLPAFTLTPNDGTVNGLPASADPAVTAVNGAPEITITNVNSFVEDSGAAVGDVVATYTTYDEDGDTVTVTLSDTVNYALDGSGNVILTAAGLALVNSGADLPAFTLTPNDGTVNGLPALADPAVTAVNDTPEITITSVNNFVEDSGAAVGDVVATYTTYDEDGDTVTVTLSDTVNYALDGNGNVTLTAAGLALVNSGADLPAFTLTPNDGTVNGLPASADPAVTAVNDAPEITITNVNNFVEDDGAAVGDVVATYTTYDQDGDTVTVTLSDTVNYALDGNGNVTLTAAGLALVNSGADLPAFTLTPNDGTVNGLPASADPAVTAVNDAPEITITNVNNFVEDDGAAVGDVVATYTTYDQDGDTVTVILSDTVNYALDGNGNVTLTAAGLALVNSGADLPAFTLTPNDGTVNGLPASADPSVTSVNDAPEITITNVNNFVEDSGAAVGDVVATYTTYDQDGDTVIVILSDTVNYALDGNGNVTLTAAGLALVNSGADLPAFTLTPNDGAVDGASASADPSVTSVNDAPEITITNVNNFVEDSGAAVGDVVATYTTYDEDGDTVTVTLSDTVNYALDGKGNVTLTAAGLALVNSGADLPAFTLTPNDGTVDGLPASANPSVTPVNDVPEITITSLNNFVEDSGATVGDVVATYTTYDEDGDTVTVTLSDTVNYALDGNGNVTLTAAGLALVNSGAELPAFTLTPNDGTVDGASASADPAVTAVNDAPEITITNVNSFVEDSGAAVGDVVATYTTYDEDGDTVTVILSDTVNYALDGNGNVTLTAAGLALVNSGADLPAFTLTPNDGTVDGLPASANPSVTPTNDAPVSGDQNLTTPEDTAISGQVVATDEEGDTLDYRVSSSPSNGSVSLNVTTGAFVYTPNVNYNGSDSFIVTIDDGKGGTTTSVINIGITPVDEVTVNSVTSPLVTEGSNLVYTVTLSGPVAGEVSLPYNLGGGSASAADYCAATFSNGVMLVGGNLIVPNGVSSFTVTVPTVDDAIAEATETLPLSVDGVTGTGSIIDNDPAPKILSIGVNHVTEGADMVCTVTFDQVLAVPYSLSYSIGGGTASLADYGTPVFSNGVTIVGGNLLVPAGINSFSITLPTVDDSIDEPTETVPFTFGGLTLAGNIYDNDAAPSVSIDSVNVNESAGTATFTVTLSAASGQAISVDYVSSNGSATAGSDYTAVSGTLNFAVGETSKTITVNIADDALFESSEDFTITLGNPSNATIGTAVGTGTIVDNDVVPNIAPIAMDDPASTQLSAGFKEGVDLTWTQPFISSIIATGGSLITSAADGVVGAMGVVGSGGTTEVDDEIQYGESILVTLNTPVVSASFGFDKLDFIGTPETGLWIAYLDGVEVGRGQFNPTDATRAGTVDIKDSSGNSIAFNQLKFDTAIYGSDYVVTWLTVGNNTATVQEGMSVNIPSGSGVLVNDLDSDGGILSVSAVRTGAEADAGTTGSLGLALQGEFGKLTLNADGSYSYTADNLAGLQPGQIAKDYFTYTLSDGQGGIDEATLTISVFGAMSSDNQFYGTTGNDIITGTNGADFISGGVGDDTMTGGLGADTFKWNLGDGAVFGISTTDTIQDFSQAQGDVLHLSELLQDENNSNLTDYLHFTYDAGENETTVHISSTGGYSGGYNDSVTDQKIVLNSLNLSGSDQDIINMLKASGNLITD